MKFCIVNYLLLLPLFFIFSCQNKQTTSSNVDQNIFRVGISGKYFTINDTAKILVGGMMTENPFQWHPAEPAIETLKSVGGNYVFCTLGSRFSGNAWPFKQGLDAKFDLTAWNDTYFIRLKKFLEITSQNRVVVHLELWDAFDFFQSNNGWTMNPFNPKNNTAYDSATSQLPEKIIYDAGQEMHPFFERADDPMFSPHTMRLMEKILEITLAFDHVIYSVGNEAYVGCNWTEFWEEKIKEIAEGKGKNITVGHTFEAPFGSVYQNSKNHESDYTEASKFALLKGQTMYDSLKENEGKNTQPFAVTHIYGGEVNRDILGEIEEAPERFWKSIFSGAAIASFAKEPAGPGFNELAKIELKSFSKLIDSVNVAASIPHNDLLLEREPNEAFLLKENDQKYALFYPGCGEVVLDLGNYRGKAQITWLNLLFAEYDEPFVVEVPDGKLRLKSYCESKWVCVVKLSN